MGSTADRCGFPSPHVNGLGLERPLPQSENDIAKDIVGFLQQFLKVFPDLKGKKLYLSGESVSSTFALMLIC